MIGVSERTSLKRICGSGDMIDHNLTIFSSVSSLINVFLKSIQLLVGTVFEIVPRLYIELRQQSTFIDLLFL